MVVGQTPSRLFNCGNPLRWLLTGGEEADITQAKLLLDCMTAAAVLADKDYDADDLIDLHSSKVNSR